MPFHYVAVVGLRNHNFIIPHLLRKNKREMPVIANICQETPKKDFPLLFLPRFCRINARKERFSVFEWRALPKAGENERTPFVFYPNPHHVQNPRLGTRFETVCVRFYTNQHVFPLSLLRLKRIVGFGKNATLNIGILIQHASLRFFYP